MQKAVQPTFIVEYPYLNDEVMKLRLGDWLRGHAWTYAQPDEMDWKWSRYNRNVEGMLVKIVLEEGQLPRLKVRTPEGKVKAPIPYPDPGQSGNVYLEVWRGSIPLDDLSDDEEMYSQDSDVI